MGVFGARFYEESRYEVLARIDHRTEIRRYVPRLAVQIELPQVDRSGRDEAFRTLFAYIAGANNASGSANARIAMTVPVALELPTRIPMTIPGLTSEGGFGVRMQFFLPGKYDFNTAPRPRDQRVTLVPLQSTTVAILRFSGSGSDCFEKQTELIAKLEGSQWKPMEPPYALFYDAPFTLPFFRRNEAAVIHCAIELPEHFDAIALENLIRDCWAKAQWGYGQILVRDGANTGWIDYMLKGTQKAQFDGFLDCVIIESLHNPIADA